MSQRELCIKMCIIACRYRLMLLMVPLDWPCFYNASQPIPAFSLLLNTINQCQRNQLPSQINRPPHLLPVNNAKDQGLHYRGAGTCITYISHAVPLNKHNICRRYWRRRFVKRTILHMSLSQRELPAAVRRPFGGCHGTCSWSLA
jgi:hypothetical protein